MAISSVTNRVAYQANGTSAVFNFPYRFGASTDLSVFVYNSSTTAGTMITPQVLNTNYIISSSAQIANGFYTNGADIIFNSTPNTQSQIVLFRSSVITNTFNVPQFGVIPSSGLNAELDTLTMIAQRLQDQTTRSVRMPDGLFGTFDPTLPPNLRQSAGKRLIVNSTASGFTFDETIGSYILNTLIYAQSNSTITSLGGGASGLFLQSNGSSAPTWAAFNIGSGPISTAQLTGVVDVVHGGTGVGINYPQYGIIYASSATQFSSIPSAQAGLFLQSNGSSVPTWAAVAVTGSTPANQVTGILPVGVGGTGTGTSYVQYGLIYASSATQFSTIPSSTAGLYLQSNGSSAPTWSAVASGSSPVDASLITGILPVTTGGTGTGTSYIQYGIIYASSATQFATVPSGAAGLLLQSNGSSAPSFQAFSATAINSGVIVPGNGGTGISNAAAATLTLGSTSISLLTTAPTSVTLPSTGTLATLAGTEIFTNKQSIVINNSSALAQSSALFVQSRSINSSAAVTIKGLSGQNADYFEIFDSAGAGKFIVDANGAVSIGHNALPEANVDIRTPIVSQTTSVGSTARFNAFIGHVTAVTSGVGAGIALGGPNTGTTTLTEYAYMWATKNTSVAGDLDTSLHIATRNNASSKAQRVVDMDNNGNSKFFGNIGMVGSGVGVQAFTQAAHASTVSYQLTWPATQGSPAQVLQNVGSGVMIWAAGGSGGGAKNYLGTVNGINGNGDFELASTQGWNTFTTTVNSSLPTGSVTPGTSTLTSFATFTNSSLAGANSLRVIAGTTWLQGAGIISDPVTIDLEDRAKVLTFKSYYRVNSGVGTANFAGTNSNTFAIYALDVTNSTWLQPAGVYGMTQSAGVGYATGSFQTSANGTQYRLSVIAINATTGPIQMDFDDFSMGPLTAPLGPALTDWIAYTPIISGFGTVSAVSFFSKREGDTLRVHGAFTAGTVSASTSSITIGYSGVSSNVTVDTNKISTSKSLLGKAGADSNSATLFDWDIVYGSATEVYLGVQNSTTPGINVPVPGTSITGTANRVSVFFEVPITGWSSNVQMSNDTDTRVVAANYQATAIQALSGTVTNVLYNSSIFDTHAAMSSGVYTIPVPGYYTANVCNVPNITPVTFSLYKNGILFEAIGVNAGTQKIAQGSCTVYGVAGDQLSVRADTNCSSVVSPSGNFFAINRLSGPAVVAATESVNMKYVNTAGTSIANSGDNNVPFATKVFDSHNAWTGTQYVVPVSGKYRVSGTLGFASSTYGVNNQVQCSVYKNSVLQSYGAVEPIMAIVTLPFGAAITTMVDCLAGDLLEIRAQNTRTAGATLLDTTAGMNHIEIMRAGN